MIYLCKIYSYKILFVDDIVLIAETEHGFRKLHGRDVNGYINEYHMHINSTKIKMLACARELIQSTQICI